MNDKPHITYTIKHDKRKSTLTLNVEIQQEATSHDPSATVPWQKFTPANARKLLGEKGHKVGPSVAENTMLVNAAAAVSGTWIFESGQVDHVPDPPPEASKKATRKAATKTKTKTTRG